MGHACNQTCERTLFCGHRCGRACHGSEKCGECRNQCVATCVHSRCRKLCNEVVSSWHKYRLLECWCADEPHSSQTQCSPCVEACDWQCEHQGKRHMVCGAPCDRLPCEKRCTKKLDCGHQCPSVCGEDCPTSLSCVLCCSQEKQRGKVDVIKFTEYKDLDLDNNPIIFFMWPFLCNVYTRWVGSFADSIQAGQCRSLCWHWKLSQHWQHTKVMPWL